MVDRLKELLHQEVKVVINHHAVGYAVHKGILIEVGMDFITIQKNRGMVLIPINQISSVDFN